jgi:hypothetical protein
MNRFYGNASGRFQSPDPGEPRWKRPATLNRYVYTADDPINYTDPTGKIMAEDGPMIDGGGGGGWDPCEGQGIRRSIVCIVTLGAIGARPGGPTPPECPLVGLTATNYKPESTRTHAIFTQAMATALDKALATLAKQDITVLITTGFRTKAENDRLKNSAKDSWHLVGGAVDVNTLDGNFEKIKKAMEDAGLTWGGDPTRGGATENHHLQLEPWGQHPAEEQIKACDREHPGGKL